ncbi:MAG TPA: UDP-N-acetylmuramoyl-L-alanyl-D-glutamate--2,6-diaminopimelate ligase, partial [Candidatus Goldiibacteriota bacterium]|nr:UDP-N-acetylmuramoyl-L-alanyl-D-glutamate--2,6-diaminopimelate ligase [Candidatus Goldiibacteriota bacterium]
KGLTADGHDFIPEALSKGASAVLAERKIRTGAASLAVAADTRKALKKIAFFMYGKNLKKAKITGVTGTKGKTTVSYMIASVLEASGRGPVSVIGTVGYRIGKKVYEAKNTTPSNLVLLKLIDESVRKNAREIVMEISSHALDQGRVDNIPLDTAVMTNVTRDHFDYHKNFKNYLAAKLKIVSCLKKNGLLVVNLDDKNADKFIGLAKGRRVCGYSMRRKACVKASGFEPSIKGSKLEVKARGEAIRVDSGLIGEHNAHNLMAAIAATAGKVRPGIIGRALSSFKGVKGRMQAVYNKRFTVVVDFAHTPGSLEETLKALETVKRGRIITVFGAGGNRDKGKRPLMGAAAEDKSDIVIGAIILFINLL